MSGNRGVSLKKKCCLQELENETSREQKKGVKETEWSKRGSRNAMVTFPKSILHGNMQQYIFKVNFSDLFASILKKNK